MKRVVLISTFCDTEKKVDILIKNLIKIKKLNLDVFVYTPFRLRDQVYELSDLVLTSKENPVFDWPKKANSHWISLTVGSKIINMYTTSPDYGFANLNQFKRLSEIALKMEYDHFFPLIYDSIIDEEILNIFKTESRSLFYKSGRDYDVWPLGLHLISFNRNSMEIFNSLITEDQYLKDLSGDAFSFIRNNIDKFDAIIYDKVIYDEIHIDNQEKLYNDSIIEGVKCFIHKNDYDDFIKIIFYSLENKTKIKISVDGNINDYEIDDWVEIKLDNVNFSDLSINFNNKEYDFGSIIKKIKNNYIEVFDNSDKN